MLSGGEIARTCGFSAIKRCGKHFCVTRKVPRALTAASVSHPVDLVVIDVSFISLGHILPSVPPFLAGGADVVALVKPQFEAGRDEVGKHGLVTDPAVHEAVLAKVTTQAEAAGFARLGMTPSPITGATGNQEFFLYLKKRQ